VRFPPRSRHEFRRRTAGRFDTAYPEISGPPGGYGPGGTHQHDRLLLAIGRDRSAAIESTSWGLGQVMGYNARLAGHDDAATMVERFCQSEDSQLLGMARFILERKLHFALKRQAWAEFARGYNGPGYAANRYATKLAENHARFASQAMPDLQLRAVQLLLTYEGFDPGPVDGYPGPRTRAAIAGFRAANRLGNGEASNEQLLAALMRRLPTADRPEPATPARVVSVMDRPPSLRLVQRMLKAIGEDPGPADGIDGPRTQDAIRRFQTRIKAGASGQAGQALLDKLIDGALAAPGPPRAVVTLAQQALKTSGFDPGPIDGIWGPLTASAANALRSREHLPAADRLDAPLLASLLGRSGQ
jgi:peptidoglycan hydrolase-like protein with peptidoglycan-binding domain